MHSIRRTIAHILIFCSLVAVLISTFFVNKAVNNTFNRYLVENQEKRNQRIVGYFQEIYKRDKKWTPNSGKELQHEGYMGNYCLVLLDENKDPIWGMDPKEIRDMGNPGDSKGEYETNTFAIRFENKIVGYILIGQYHPILLSEEEINFKTSINEYIAVSVLITVAVIILASVFFSRQFSNPVKEVSDTSVNLSRGDYEARSHTKSNVFEINNLIRSINILGERLKHQDDIRKRLVSDISHEIRTPLNVLQNNLEAMIDGVFSPTVDRLNNLNNEVIRFGKLLNNLDVLKQFEEEKLEFKLEEIYVDEFLSGICNDFFIQARNKGIELVFTDESEEKSVISGDRNKLRQVFVNILSNAVKFTGNGGKIWVNVDCSKTRVFVRIRDTGMGIKEEDLPFIFERLYRGDKSRHEIEGSGIGLTIAKRIIDLHSAAIDVESTEGKGSCFTISFKREI